MRHLTLLLILTFSSVATATEDNLQETEKKQINFNNIERVSEQVEKLDSDINILLSKTEEAKSKQSKLNDNINDNYILQKSIESSVKKLLSALESKNNEIKPLQIELKQPTNYFVFALPAVTLIIVIAGTILSIKTITIKSKESLDAISDSNEHQRILNENIIRSELERSREVIVSNNRQKWINTLRDDISKFLSTTTKLVSDKSESNNGGLKRENVDALWLEFYKIQLLLNPNEEDHNNLISYLRDVIAAINDTNAFTNKRSDVIETSQIILKHEWERVKRFE